MNGSHRLDETSQPNNSDGAYQQESHGGLVQRGGIEMNLKGTLLFLLPAAFMLLLVACGGGSQIADTPTPEAKVVAKAIAQPTPTKEPPKSEPAKPPASKPIPIEARPTALAKVAEVASATTPVPTPSDTPIPDAKVQTKPSSTSVISWDQGKDYIGTSTTLCGPVIGTTTDRGSQGNPTHAYLYIGKPSSDPGRFVVKITGRIRGEFANRDPENYYLGKSICITGLIKKIKDQQESGIPGIIVDNPSQIEMSVKSATTMTLWTKDYSFSKTPIESSEYIKGVNTEQWKTIGEIGDSANCERRVEEITNIANANTISEELHKKDTEAIYESVKRNEFTVLTSGTYELHRTLSIGDGHKLIGQGEIILLANNIDIGIKLDSGSISGLRIMNAGNEGVM